MFAILSKDIRYSRRVGRELKKLGILTFSLNASTSLRHSTASPHIGLAYSTNYILRIKLGIEYTLIVAFR